MINVFNLTIIALIVLFSSCVSTSMTPVEINNKLPTLTKSKFISQYQADEMTKNNTCRSLVKNRSYAAPLGLSTMGDLKNAAKGIDEWVKLDGGNAYVLKNYKWVQVDQNGSTQLTVEFDTFLCE